MSAVKENFLNFHIDELCNNCCNTIVSPQGDGGVSSTNGSKRGFYINEISGKERAFVGE